jgi:hypothetical protein
MVRAAAIAPEPIAGARGVREGRRVSSGRIAVCLEVSEKHAVACALDWPGCRAGPDDAYGAGRL